MSIFKRFTILFFSVTMISICMLRWYAMEFLYRTPEKYWPGMPTTIGATLFVMAIVLAVVFRMTRPFNEVIQKAAEGRDVSQEETRKALAFTKKLM